MNGNFQFDPIDIDLMLIRGRLTPGQRLQAMLDAREFLVALMRSRLRQRFPDLTSSEINLLVLKEIDLAQKIES